MARIWYARVSSSVQNLERQFELSERAKVKNFF